MDPRTASGPPLLRRTAGAQYVVAAAAVLSAAALVVAFRTWLSPNYLYVLLAAVVIASWHGGLGPGLLATVLATAAAGVLFMDPEGTFWIVHPEEGVRLAVFALLGLGTSWMGEQLLAARARAEAGAAESRDMAARLTAQAAELADAHDRLSDRELLLRTLADTVPVLVWMAGPDGRLTFVNQPWSDFTGRPAAQELGTGWHEGIHPDDLRRCLAIHHAAIAAQRPFQVEFRLRRHDGDYRWLLDAGVPRFSPEGDFAGYVGSCVDITERRGVEDRQRFLADAGTVLGSSLDSEETLRRVARLAVPVLADYCVVDLCEEDGSVRRMEAAHALPELEEATRGLLLHPPLPGSGSVVSQVLATGTPHVENEVTPEMLARSARDDGHLALLLKLAPTAYMVVPMLARGRVLGSLLFGARGRSYGDAELVQAEEVARRAALAIENARLYAAALEANRARSDFLAVMSHELRTPLNAVLGYADLMLMGIPAPLPPELVPRMERMRTSAHHLLDLIEEILTFSRLQAGRESADRERVRAAELAEQAAAVVEPLAAQRGLAFRVETEDPALEVETDPRKVRQVLVQLLGNAVKFTDAGEVWLRVEGGATQVFFHVGDTGMGIAAEDRERIFEPFRQVEQATVRTHGGSGLGLSLAREMAHLLGGDVSVRSEPGRGSVFTLRVPLRLPSSAPRA